MPLKPDGSEKKQHLTPDEWDALYMKIYGYIPETVDPRVTPLFTGGNLEFFPSNPTFKKPPRSESGQSHS